MILDTRLVIAAIDFTDEDWAETVAHAAHHARTRGVGVHLVHVVPKTPWLLRKVLDDSSVEALQDDQHAAARRRLAETCERLKQTDLPASYEIRSGKPANQVLAAIETTGAGLLVIGVGQPSATAMLIGGTADRLLRTSPIPVLIRGPKPPADVQHILVPTALGPSGAAAVERATHLVSQVEGGTVSALHMVALPGVMRAYSGDVVKLRAALEEQARKELDAHVAPIGSDRVQTVLRCDLETRSADQTILAEARERKVDLICLALGGRTLRNGPLIGRVSHRVIRALPCPLLALPDRWIDASSVERAPAPGSRGSRDGSASTAPPSAA